MLSTKYNIVIWTIKNVLLFVHQILINMLMMFLVIVWENVHQDIMHMQISGLENAFQVVNLMDCLLIIQQIDV